MHVRNARRKSLKLHSPYRNKVLLIMIMASLCCPLLRIRLKGENRNEPEDIRRISKLVQELCARFELAVKINAVIVDENKFGVSVEPLADAKDEYTLSFDRKLYESLTSDELTAAIAHEMGHVWIFRHHPYLQTEPLANEIAFRVVSRETMKAVYTKLWLRLGISGNLSEVLGPDLPATVAKSTAVTSH